ncbi:MAG: nucleotidyltransferase family protein [Chitinophagaceae bacterium]
MKECIILAGGLGTRLRTVLADLPKCMAPVAGRPFIDYVIDYFLAQGIEKFILALGYKAEVIIGHMEQNYPDLDIQYSIEIEPLGTGGAIKKACKMLDSDMAVITNGDTLYKIDLSQAIMELGERQPDCTLLLKPMQNFERYGVVELDSQNKITAFKEKQFYESGLINGGVYLLTVPSFLKEVFTEKFSFEKDFLEALYPLRNLCGLVQDAYFIDIGIPEDFERAQVELM